MSDLSVAHASTSLAARPAGYSVMVECLRLMSTVGKRSAVARLCGARPVSDDARPWFDGAIGKIAVWDSELTAAQIAAHTSAM